MALLRRLAAGFVLASLAARAAPPLPAEEDAFPYAELIPDVVSYCYDRLIKDSSCCMDKKYQELVAHHPVTRNGTRWTCGEGCFDDLTGERGDDLLWVPDEATCESPRLLWMHGGSWEYGSPSTESYGQLASKLAGMSGAVVMVPDYPLAPVGNYSTIMRAALAALQWLAEAPRLGVLDCSGVRAPLFIGGDSAGGGTALSMALELKMQAGWSPTGIETSHPDALPGGQLLAGAVFFSPWTNLRCDSPDYYYNSFAKIVGATGDVYVGDIMFRGHPKQNLDEFTANAKSYVGTNHSLLDDPIASPFFAGAKELGGGGIPPLYFAVGGSESILSDSLIFAQKAALYGAHVQLDVMVGMWHDFPMYSEGCGGGQELWQAVRALNRTAQFIRQVGEKKALASQWGLLWPPADYHPNTPRTTYVYDLTRQDTNAWYPRSLDALAMRVDDLLEKPPAAAASQAPVSATALPLVAAGAAALGALAVLGFQAGAAWASRWRGQAQLQAPLL